MYRELAEHYDRTYSGKDYVAETSRLVDVIRERYTDAKTLLDVACGTGGHLQHMTGHFECEGVDLSQEMLEQARQKAPGVPLHACDMTKLNLGRGFDVITCLFSSIAYVGTVERLNRSVARMTSHLNPNGVLIIEPWVMPESWLSETLNGRQAGENTTTGAELAAYPPAERGLVAMRKMVPESAKVNGLRDGPKLAWFMRNEYKLAFRKAGLRSEFLDHGLTSRGLFICAHQ